MARARLLDVERRPRAVRSDCTDLVPRALAVCPDCDAPLARATTDQRALFFHGGYGGTERTVTEWCGCGWVRVVERTTENPRRI